MHPHREFNCNNDNDGDDMLGFCDVNEFVFRRKEEKLLARVQEWWVICVNGMGMEWDGWLHMSGNGRGKWNAK